MCWTGKAGNHFIAESPKRVFKVLEREPKCWSWLNEDFIPEYFSPFMGFRYVIGKEYVQKIVIDYRKPLSDLIEITKGLHSYSSEKCKAEKHDILDHPSCEGMLSVTHISGGIIMCYELDIDSPLIRKSVVVECTIPVGAEYYENETGEIVSDRLILNKEITI